MSFPRTGQDSGRNDVPFARLTRTYDIEPRTPDVNDGLNNFSSKLSGVNPLEYTGLLAHSHHSGAANDASLSVVPGRRFKLGLKLFALTILVIIGSAGMATFFLLWLLLHQTDGRDAWKDKAFFLDEGTKMEGDQEAARLLGLTISSAASKVVTFTTPFLVGLYSFYVARSWLRLGDVGSEGLSLPTPLQYGLVINLLSDAGLGSLITTIRYFSRNSQRRVGITSFLTHVFITILLVYILTNAIGIVDLWLHAVTATVIQHTTTPLDTPFKFSIDQVLCPPYPDPWYTAINPCLMTEGGWGGGVDSKVPGMLVRANNSNSLQTITLAEADDMAILVKPNISQFLEFRATSFGARASCQSVNPLCDPRAVTNCTGFPFSFPPYNGSFTADPVIRQGESKLFIQSSNCAWDVPEEKCPHISSDRITTDAAALNSIIPPINSYNLWMQFLWEAEGDQVYGAGAGNASGAVTSYSNVATMLTNCTLQFYNVTVDYSNGSYSLHDAVLSNVGLSDGLAAPTRLGHFASYLISNVEGHVFTDSSSEELMAFLQQDLARLALGSAAIITNVTSDTLMQSALGSRIVGRYPFWPVFVFLALLYIYAAVALGLFFLTVLTMQTESLVLSGRTAGMGDGSRNREAREEEVRKVSLLELAQMRLCGPLPLVATLFPPYHPDVSQAALSMETNALDLFCENSNDERIRAGLYSDDANASLRFRVHRNPYYTNRKEYLDGERPRKIR